MRSKLTNKLLQKMGRLFLGYVWRVGRAKLDFWLSLHLYCTKILATQTFWELWPQNWARPVIKKIRKLSKIVQRLVTTAGTGINFLGETAAQYLHPSLQICTLSHALLWKSVDFEEWSDRKTLDQNFSDLALQFSDRSIKFLYSSAVCLLPFRIKGNTPDWTM